MKPDPIHVTRPSLAPLEEYNRVLEGIWESGILTHNGPLVQQFEKDLCAKFEIPHFAAVTNGTVAMQIAIRALGLKGEIITTPFTWIATVSAIIWEGCTPVFADIDPETLNIDPERIEEKITAKTCAIMPVHVFGNPCDIEAIETIAAKYGLKVIYDAAHAVGSMYDNKSLLNFGDISATSLHATKILNTAEGGGCVTRDPELHELMKEIRFFGHDDNKMVVTDGLNGKMTEIHAALGIVNLKYFDQVFADRKNKCLYYQKHLSDLEALSFQKIVFGESNHCYFPVIFRSEELLEKVVLALNQKNIHPRRYFYPSVNTYKSILPYEEMRISESISRRILCLPLYFDLRYEQVEEVTVTIRNVVTQ